jgi:hypothetical protein
MDVIMNVEGIGVNSMTNETIMYTISTAIELVSVKVTV